MIQLTTYRIYYQSSSQKTWIIWSGNILISSVEYFDPSPSTVWNFENFRQNHTTPHIASTTIFSNDFNRHA